MLVSRIAQRRNRIGVALTLIGATMLLVGCGDGAHLPAGSTSANMSASGGSALDGVLGGDPGPQVTSRTVSLDDPVLGDYSGIDGIDAMGDGDMWATAATELNDASSGLGAASFDAPMLDDEPYGLGYGGYGGYGDGYASGWGNTLGTGGLYNAYGYGSSVGMAAFNTPALDAGLADGGIFDDPTFDDLGGSIDDPFVGMAAADTSIDDGGFDFASAPVDFGGADFGGADFSGGFDAAPIDVGGAVDIAPIDVGGFDTGGIDIGGMDAGIGF